MASVLPVWDVLFSHPMRTRDANPKLDMLVDICTSLVIRARAPLFRSVKDSFQLAIVLNLSRLGKPGGKSPGLWAEEYATIPPPSPLRPWELNNAFLEGTALLQSYPIEAGGGIDRVLQTAHDLAQRRIEESRSLKSENVTLSARIKATVWKGFTNQVTDTDDVEEEEEEESSSDEEDSQEDGNETETPDAPTLTSRFANTVWRGITNQSSMDNSPSPPSPTSPLGPPSPQLPPSAPEHTTSSSSLSSPPSIWGYAEKLKDSDAVATFTKVSTNWRARAMSAWSTRQSNSASNADVPSPASVKSELPPSTSNGWSSQSDGASNSRDSSRRGSLPGGSTAFDDTPRPAFFRSPRESFLPLPRREAYTVPQSPEIQPQQDLMHKAQVSLASLAAFNSRMATPPRPPRSAPRPLLLNSSSLITAKSPPSAHSDSGLPVKRYGEWAGVSKGHALRTDSVSSISSLSPSDIPNSRQSKSDVESDGGSRRVALNRKSISPMAPASRALRSRATSPLSGTSDLRMHDPMSRAYTGLVAEDSSSERGWRGYDVTDASTTVSSPPIPTPITVVHDTGKVRVNSESWQSSISEDIIPLRPPSVLLRKKTPPPIRRDPDNSDSSQSRTPSRNPPLRSKRRPRLPSLQTRDNNLRPVSIVEYKNINSNTLAPPHWPEEQEIAMTPRAIEFASTSPASASTASPHSPRPRRKTSAETVRSRKISGGSDVRFGKPSPTEALETRDSAAEEGDDEGYDDILSAYESEEGSRE
jgi:hypothetical protein